MFHVNLRRMWIMCQFGQFWFIVLFRIFISFVVSCLLILLITLSVEDANYNCGFGYFCCNYISFYFIYLEALLWVSYTELLFLL